MPLNKVSFCGKNGATGCPFLAKIMRQGITFDKNIRRQVSRERRFFRVLSTQLIMYTLGKMFI